MNEDEKIKIVNKRFGDAIHSFDISDKTKLFFYDLTHEDENISYHIGIDIERDVILFDNYEDKKKLWNIISKYLDKALFYI